MSAYLAISSGLIVPSCLLTTLTTPCMLFLAKRKSSGILTPIISSLLWLTGLTLFFCLILYPLCYGNLFPFFQSEFSIGFNLPALETEKQIIIIGYFAATWGTFLGADVLNLPLLVLSNNFAMKVSKPEHYQTLQILNIGGAGIKDGIFLYGIYTGILTEGSLCLYKFLKSYLS